MAAGPLLFLPGEQKDIDTKLPNGMNYGFPVNTMHIVANKARLRKPGGSETVLGDETASGGHQRPERDDARGEILRS